LTNPATGQIRQVVSNGAGAYRFANVGVGTYMLREPLKNALILLNLAGK
jgi:hypothetical protein